MPRIVDHEERRRELVRTIWDVIREGGLEAVTVRTVAARSGWSSGAVRHYLPTRESMLTTAALEVLNGSREYLEATPRTGDPMVDFRTVLLRTLPMDEESRLFLEVWLAFAGAAVSGAEPARHALLYADLHDFLGTVLADFARAGWLPAPEVTGTALELHGLLDGLAVHLLLHQVTPEQAEDALSGWLRRTLRPPA